MSSEVRFLSKENMSTSIKFYSSERPINLYQKSFVEGEKMRKGGNTEVQDIEEERKYWNTYNLANFLNEPKLISNLSEKSQCDFIIQDRGKQRN